jgi:hypothetical protein
MTSSHPIIERMSPATLREFAAMSDAAAATTKKLEKRRILGEYFGAIDDENELPEPTLFDGLGRVLRS